MSVGAAAFAGCSSAAATDSAEETPAEAQEALQCCTGGTFTCTATGYEVEYAVPNVSGCPGITKPTASANCKAHCAHTCVDSGWSTSCF